LLRSENLESRSVPLGAMPASPLVHCPTMYTRRVHVDIV
jgi:hypothetical protein